jgi:hypothetical protein
MTRGWIWSQQVKLFAKRCAYLLFDLVGEDPLAAPAARRYLKPWDVYGVQPAIVVYLPGVGSRDRHHFLPAVLVATPRKWPLLAHRRLC